jgi:hypothetical protein
VHLLDSILVPSARLKAYVMEMTSLLRVLRSHVTLCVTSITIPSAGEVADTAAAQTVDAAERVAKMEEICIVEDGYWMVRGRGYH